MKRSSIRELGRFRRPSGLAWVLEWIATLVPLAESTLERRAYKSALRTIWRVFTLLRRYRLTYRVLFWIFLPRVPATQLDHEVRK
jgi:hypothetical protein